MKVENPIKKLKVGQIGVGNFGAQRRLWMRETGLFDLVCAFDCNPQFLQNAVQQDGAQPVKSYQELLDFPELDAVFICTGAKFHAAQLLAALEKRLPVFIEKPLCCDPAELVEVVRAFRAAKVPVGMGHHDHSAQQHAALVKNWIETGELGQIVSVEATTCHSGSFHIKDGDWRGDAEKNPGGMLFQCGVHKLHELMFYLGPIYSVSALMRYDVNSKTQTADAALVHLQFRNGVIGSLNAYHVTPYRHFIHIYGTKANVYIEYYGPQGTTLHRQNAAPNYDNSVETVEKIEIDPHENHTASLQSFYRAVTSGETPYPSLEDGARAVAVVFAAEKAAHSGVFVPVATLGGSS